MLSLHIVLKVLWLGKEQCYTTWEPEEELLPSLIMEFESGAQLVVSDCRVTSGVGGVTHTLTVSSSGDTGSNTSRPIVNDSDG